MNFEEWTSRIRSKKTRELYAKWVNQFAEFYDVKPEDTLSWQVEEIEDRMIEFKNYLQTEYHLDLADKLGYDFDSMSGSTIRQYWAALKRWFGENRIYIRVPCKDTPRNRKSFDYIPTPEILKLILDEAKLKYKVAFSLIAFSGMRPSDVCNLRYESVKLSLSRNDEVVDVVVKQKKTGGWYTTFLAPQGAKFLKQLIELRMNQGDKFQNKTYVVSNSGKPMSPVSLRWAFNSIRDRITSKNPTGEPFRLFRLYGLRKYFRKNISRHLDESEAEYLMGHVGGLRSLASRYSGLADMDLDAIARLKEKYREAMKYLETEPTESLVDRLKREISKYLSEEELENLSLGGGKTLKEEWSPELIIKALQRAMSES